MRCSLQAGRGFDILYGKGIPAGGSLIDMGVDWTSSTKSGAQLPYEGSSSGQERCPQLLGENADVAIEIERESKEKLELVPW